jgi:hypothetical protein
MHRSAGQISILSTDHAMSRPMFYTDLTQRPPRSFRVRLGGYVILARMLDKGRATLAKKNGEYGYNSSTDQRLVKFLGFDPDAMLKELAAGKSDGEILAWVESNSKTPRTPWEIEAWTEWRLDKKLVFMLTVVWRFCGVCPDAGFRETGVEVLSTTGKVWDGV